MSILPVVLCGGIGERIQPFLNSKLPKQFNSIHSECSLLQETILRVQGDQFLPPILFGQKGHEDVLKREIDGFNVERVFLEPCRRNTLAPVVLAALYAQQNEVDRILVVPSDHVIHDVKQFQQDVLNFSGEPVTYFGIVPDKPSSEYGYIIHNDDGIHFHEKPDIEMAAELISKGALWNSGVFLININGFLHDFESLNKLLLKQIATVFETINSFDIPECEFSKLPSIPFDKAYCERTNKGHLVRANFDWMDIGSVEMLKKARAS